MAGQLEVGAERLVYCSAERYGSILYCGRAVARGSGAVPSTLRHVEGSRVTSVVTVRGLTLSSV